MEYDKEYRKILEVLQSGAIAQGYDVYDINEPNSFIVRDSGIDRDFVVRIEETAP